MNRLRAILLCYAVLIPCAGDALGDDGREVSSELEGKYPTREYCVQYQESDLDFVHRLMEEEGISYAFDHEGEVELMVLRDANDAFLELPSGKLVPFQPNTAEIKGSEPICRFSRRHRPRTTSVVARDWDWTRGGDMKVESCRKQLRIGDPPNATMAVIEILKQNEMLVATVSRDGRTHPRRIEVPVENYLAQAVGDLLAQLRDRGKTLIVSNHDIAQSLHHADRVVVLSGGRIAVDCPVSEVAPADVLDVMTQK